MSADSQFLKEVNQRRTFAIISHPDAGKTTLTEKLLLYSGAIQSAGSVKGKATQKKATSDWMELEKQRGISVTSTVLQFPYRDYVLNLLDTPGHNDFSADTYRTLTAADSAVMIVDYAKGVEAQTRKLFAVCSDRGIPIFTFVNKLDHDGLGPLALMENIDEALGMTCVPMNWPIGEGIDFRGVYDRESKIVELFQKGDRGSKKASTSSIHIDDPKAIEILGEAHYNKLIEDIELLDVAHDPIDLELVSRGQQSPMYFGSALTNFGVEAFLNSFLNIAPAPHGRDTLDGIVTETTDDFSAFIFKIQANMNPEHRDRIVFIRIVSGQFEKDMEVIHVQSGKTLRLSRPQRVFAHERETIETAYPGDIIGIPNPGFLLLGDTLAVGKKVAYAEVPAFTPEMFASISNLDASRFKHYDKGVMQLAAEGLVELFSDPRSDQKQYILGAVGMLQFEVVQFRLATEYGVKTDFGVMNQRFIRWFEGDVAELRGIYLPTGAKQILDKNGNVAILFGSEYEVGALQGKLKDAKLLLSAPR
jgi:peptide chain release factor 3